MALGGALPGGWWGGPAVRVVGGFALAPVASFAPHYAQAVPGGGPALGRQGVLVTPAGASDEAARFVIMA